MLGHFGTDDQSVPVDDAKALEREMEEAGVTVRFEFYGARGTRSSTTTIASAPTTLGRPSARGT